ncbi:MAG: DUF1566 domain-containing protein [Chloroflexota bacterium]
MKTRIAIHIFVTALLAAGCAPAVSATQTVPLAAEQASASAPTPTTANTAASSALTYPIVDTAQTICYANDSVIPCPQDGAAFFGQDGNHQGRSPAYQDNGDGTVTDLVTSLMWTQSPDLNGDGTINIQDKLGFDAAQAYAGSLDFAGHDDWRVPTIKELYSLMDFNGYTGVSDESFSSVPANAVPYIDTRYFAFGYGDTSAGERYIDAQFATSTKYVSTTMNGNETMFGVNFADGRIKGYGLTDPRGNGEKTFYVLFVRGNPDYGQNAFVDNGNGTVTDNATGLTWLQPDSGAFNAGPFGDGSLNWEQALDWCESLDYAGASDWRLPDIKELQSIVDYTRSPDTTNSAAIDPLFQTTFLTDGINNNGYPNYPHTWSSTTHLDGVIPEARAAYIAFGEAQGLMNGTMLDVHGAGAQRSDLKSGDPASLPIGQGPQGDVQSIYNYARCVRGGVTSSSNGDPITAPLTIQVESTGVPMPTGQGPQGGLPPQVAIDACAASTVGAACSFAAPNGMVSGTCQLIQSQLACVPANHP